MRLDTVVPSCGPDRAFDGDRLAAGCRADGFYPLFPVVGMMGLLVSVEKELPA
jgi:hypothetical protein